MTPALTDLLDEPLPQLVARVASGELHLSPTELDAVVAEHALRVENGGSRSDLLTAADALHDLATWARQPGGASELRAGARFEVLAEHLTAKATRSDRGGVDALLRGHDGKPAQLLSLLAAAPEGTLPRAGLGPALGTGESHVSHILRSLYDAGLVHRRQQGRTVTLTISERGRAALGPSPEVAEGRGPRRLAPGVRAMLEDLPSDRRAEINARPTLAPVIDFPAVAGA